jgi:hypothetical protein
MGQPRVEGETTDIGKGRNGTWALSEPIGVRRYNVKIIPVLNLLSTMPWRHLGE